MSAWLSVPGFHRALRVSGDGRVRMNAYVNRAGHQRVEREIAIHDDRHGHLRVNVMSASGASTNAYVHRLVALAFIPNPDDKPQVNHIDGDRRNNATSNLEWATQSENMRHSYRTLGRVGGKPLRPVVGIHRDDGRRVSYPSIKRAAKAHGLYVGNVQAACAGRIKSSGGFVWRYE